MLLRDRTLKAYIICLKK